MVLQVINMDAMNFWVWEPRPCPHPHISLYMLRPSLVTGGAAPVRGSLLACTMCQEGNGWLVMEWLSPQEIVRSKEEHDCDTCAIYQEKMWIQPRWVGIV